MPNDVINTVTINGTTYDIGGSGGHTIKNPAGTAMTQRSNLQFVDLTISDDSTNNATKVESVHMIQSESELANLPDGLYMLDEDEGTVIDGSAVGYDNTDSELNAENVQDAIDEVVDALDDKIDISVKGVANGVAELDSAGKVPSNQLPSFVDDVIEVADHDHLPATGETGKIYVALDTNKTYRWGGTEYVEISESLALGETSSTAYRGDRGKTAYDHSQLTSGNPHNVTKSDIGLDNVDNTSDSTKKTNFTGSIASGDTGFTTGGDVYTALGGKADKVSSATNGNLAGLNGSGNLTDSGWNGAKDTTSISGNPISIPNLKANQLAKDPIITFEPIQAGSGTPSPSNIRAISGYDKVEVESCGKNILPLTLDNIKKASVNSSPTGSWSGNTWSGGGITIEVQYDNYGNVSGLKANGTATQSVIFIFASNVNLKYAQYTFSGCPSGGTGETYRMDARNMATSIMVDTGEGVTFQASAGNKGYALIRVQQGTSVSNLIFKPQLEESETKTAFEPYHKATSISESLGQTVYGGTLDVRTGKLVSILKALDMSTMNWQYSSGLQLFYCYVSDIAQSNTMWCSCYNPSVQPITENYTITSRYGYYVENPAIVLKDTRYTDVTSLKNALTGQIVVYTVVEPDYTTIQLIPHEISLLKDYAYVSTNGTSISLDYHNGELASLSDVSQLGESLNALGDLALKQQAYQNGNTAQIKRVMEEKSMYVYYTNGGGGRKFMWLVVRWGSTFTQYPVVTGSSATVTLSIDNTSNEVTVACSDNTILMGWFRIG